MKKNLIFGIGLVLVVLMASGVFAGWFGLTGNALRTGERIAQDSSLKVNEIEENKVIIGNEIYSKGETFTDSGKTYEVKAIEKKAWFFGSDKVVIEEVEPVEPKPVETCTDSDGGLNYYVKGSVTFEGDIGVDNCFDSNTLVELYCTSNKGGGAGRNYICPNGCVNGACVKDNLTEQEVTYEGVFGVLGNLCTIVQQGEYGAYNEENCHDVCKVYEEKYLEEVIGSQNIGVLPRCVSAFRITIYRDFPNKGDFGYLSYPINCGDNFDYDSTAFGDEELVNYQHYCNCCYLPIGMH